jgi:AcrR family transcriptional regulator
VELAGLRRNKDRGHQRPVGCPGGDGLPAVLIQARDPLSSKLGILKALLDVSVAGDDEDIPLAARPQARALLQDPEPRNQLTGFAGITRGIMSRAEPVYRILVSAAGSDPDAAELLVQQIQHRDRGQEQIARALARAGTLRPGLTERDAADIIHALMSPEVHRLLTGDRGWPPERYQQWLQDALISQLLPPS